MILIGKCFPAGAFAWRGAGECPQFFKRRRRARGPGRLQTLELPVREDGRLHGAGPARRFIGVFQCARRRRHQSVHLVQVLAQLRQRPARPD